MRNEPRPRHRPRDPRLLVPFLGWVALYIGALYFFVPRLGRIARVQADARSRQPRDEGRSPEQSRPPAQPRQALW